MFEYPCVKHSWKQIPYKMIQIIQLCHLKAQALNIEHMRLTWGPRGTGCTGVKRTIETKQKTNQNAIRIITWTIIWKICSYFPWPYSNQTQFLREQVSFKRNEPLLVSVVKEQTKNNNRGAFSLHAPLLCCDSESTAHDSGVSFCSVCMETFHLFQICKTKTCCHGPTGHIQTCCSVSLAF